MDMLSYFSPILLAVPDNRHLIQRQHPSEQRYSKFHEHYDEALLMKGIQSRGFDFGNKTFRAVRMFYV